MTVRDIVNGPGSPGEKLAALVSVQEEARQAHRELYESLGIEEARRKAFMKAGGRGKGGEAANEAERAILEGGAAKPKIDPPKKPKKTKSTTKADD